MQETFRKDERLCSKKQITKLFEEGRVIHQYPFRITYLFSQLSTEEPAQLMIAVPRHLFRKAVHRNKIKRLVREAYRKNKHLLYLPLKEQKRQVMFCLSYTSKEILPYHLIREKIIVLLQRLSELDAKNTG